MDEEWWPQHVVMVEVCMATLALPCPLHTYTYICAASARFLHVGCSAHAICNL